VVTQRPERDLSNAAAAITRDRGGCSRRRDEAAFGQVRGVRESRGVTHDNTNAGTAVATRTELFDPPLVQHRRRRRSVLDEDLRKFASTSHRFAQRALQDVVFYQGAIHSCERTGANRWLYATFDGRK
jgi:hypothetical protein